MKPLIILPLTLVVLLSACSAQPGERTLGEMAAAQAGQTAIQPTPTHHVIVVTATPEAPSVQPTATPETAPPDSAPQNIIPCRDGELVIEQWATQGALLNRIMVGEAERVTVLHLSWPGKGFAGLDRAIIIVPRQGPVWQTFAKSGTYSVATRAFCGSNEEVARWAVQAEVTSLRRASADRDGNMPEDSEIGVYLLNFEEGTLAVVKSAPDGPGPEEVLGRLEVNFNDGQNNANVPLRVVR